MIASDARVGGESRELLAQRSQAILAVDGAELLQRVVAISDGAPIGGSMKGKSSIRPSPSDAICKMTDVKLVRTISGGVKSGRSRKSSSE